MSSPDQHAYFAAPGQLEDVFVTSIDFTRNPEFDFDVHDAPLYAINAKIEASLSPDRSQVNVTFDAAIEWASHDDEDEPGTDNDAAVRPFDLALTLGGTFSWMVPDADQEDVISWIRFNTEHLFWPYLRAYVQQITGSSDLPPLTLYTIRVPRPRLGIADDQSTEHQA